LSNGLTGLTLKEKFEHDFLMTSDRSSEKQLSECHIVIYEYKDHLKGQLIQKK